MVTEKLIKDIELLRSIMITVSTGGGTIQQMNTEYMAKYQEVDDLLSSEGIENPNPYLELWRWHGRWSSGDLPSYRDRREYIGNMYDPLLKELRARKSGITSKLEVEPTGWTRVDRGVDKIKEQLEKAKNEEDFQGVGLLCREALISLSEAVYDESKHKTLDAVVPSATDANRKLEAYVSTELGGKSNEAVRRVIKSALVLANDLQHRRTATFKEASLCAQSTFTVINSISIVSGHLHP
ncbi:hypothetical protein ACFL60_06645 [Candidatus Omnitrophota bacterium]